VECVVKVDLDELTVFDDGFDASALEPDQEADQLLVHLLLALDDVEPAFDHVDHLLVGAHDCELDLVLLLLADFDHNLLLVLDVLDFAVLLADQHAHDLAGHLEFDLVLVLELGDG